MKQIEDPPPPEDITITQVIKLRRGALIMQFRTKEAAEWIQNPDAEISFSVHFLSGATIKPRQYAILVPRAPTTFDPENEDHLREIEESNGLPERAIAKAKWIKPVYRRRPDQRVAHATFMLIDPKAANKCIKEGIYICGMRVQPARLKQEPTQCMKCRRWGHFANECLAEKDTCGTCGGEHRTNSCTEAEKRFCASCETDTHASWDRKCPEFAKKCTWYDQKHPDNLLKYFPTDDGWTQEIRPERIPISERFPARFAVGSLPPANKNGRDMPTREVTQSQSQRRTRGKGKSIPGQATLDSFLMPSQKATDSNGAEEGELEQDSSLFLSADSHYGQSETWADICAEENETLANNTWT